MRASIASIVYFAACATALAQRKSVIVSYPDDTPDSVLEEAKAAIVSMGGVITHEYNLIKGFAAMASEKALDLVQTQGQTNHVLVEQDQVIKITKS